MIKLKIVHKGRKAKYITNSKSFQSGWSSVIADRETNFVNRLNTWKTNNNLTITNLDNIFVFDDYKTTNWKISGLEIKSLTVPYYITSKDTTRASNTTESLAILEKLFVGDNALFKYGKNCDNGYNVTTLRFFLKPDAYDDFRERNVTVQTIYDYVTTQTINAGTKGGFIKDTDKVKWTSGTNERNWLNQKPKSYFLETQKWRLVINGNAFSLSVNYGQPEYKKYLTCFDFTKGDTQYGI